MIDQVLIRLFERHFADPVAALRRLEKHLAEVPLPFNLNLQLRELTYPPQPDFPNGLPSFIYYFLPGTGWGSQNPFPGDPLHPDFVKAADGVSLNLGCPVRLLRALDAMSHLHPQDQTEIKNNLANPTQHFAAVEELLWLTGWKSASNLRRGGTIPGASGNVDWAFNSRGFPSFLEAKFRPSDWPRLSDNGTFAPMPGSLLGKAAHKFPPTPHEPALYVVGITTFENLTEELLRQLSQELRKSPQIHAVVLRSFAQTTHVISLDVRIRDTILGMLAIPTASDYPTNYSILVHIQQRDNRVMERVKVPDQAAGQSKPPASCWGIEPLVNVPIIFAEDAYRTNIVSRGPEAEPHFEVIPKKIWVPA